MRKHTSYAQLLARDSKAALEAEYSDIGDPTLAIRAEVDEIKMIRPPDGIYGKQAWVKKNGPEMFVSKTVEYCSCVTLAVGPMCIEAAL